MYSITRNGKPLDKQLYTIDEEKKIFSSYENGLVLDFSDTYGWHFKTGYECTFNTGSDCVFDTGYGCTFKTGSECTFNTGSDCTFDTGAYCTFDTGSHCTFDTGYECTFKTGYQCVVVRRDVYEVIELDGTKKIKLNQFQIKGYTII